MSLLRKKYRRISRRLTNFELQRLKKPNLSLSMEDLTEELEKKGGSEFFLGFYSEEGIRTALDRFGILGELEGRGFANLKIVINTRDPYRQKLRLYFERKAPSHLLAEFYVRKYIFKAKPIFQTGLGGQIFEMVAVEWLLLQNPRASFTPRHPQLPGQQYPGLGMGEKVLEILRNMCLRLRADGLLNIPEHYHNAILYASEFKYFNPETEGKLWAIHRDLRDWSLADLSWAIEWGCLQHKGNGARATWVTEEQILATSQRLKNYFDSSEYKKRVKESLKSHNYQIDVPRFEREKRFHPFKE